LPASSNSIEAPIKPRFSSLVSPEVVGCDIKTEIPNSGIRTSLPREIVAVDVIESVKPPPYKTQ